MYLSVVYPSVKNAPFHRGEGVINVCCESAQHMFLVLFSGTNHSGGTSPRETGVYIAFRAV